MYPTFTINSSLFPYIVFITVHPHNTLSLPLSLAIFLTPVSSMLTRPFLLAVYQMLSPGPQMDKIMPSILPEISFAAAVLNILSVVPFLDRKPNCIPSVLALFLNFLYKSDKTLSNTFPSSINISQVFAIFFTLQDQLHKWFHSPTVSVHLSSHFSSVQLFSLSMWYSLGPSIVLPSTIPSQHSADASYTPSTSSWLSQAFQLCFHAHPSNSSLQLYSAFLVPIVLLSWT